MGRTSDRFRDYDMFLVDVEDNKSDEEKRKKGKGGDVKWVFLLRFGTG